MHKAERKGDYFKIDSVVDSVQGLPDMERKIFLTEPSEDFIEVYYIEDNMGEKLWTTDLSRGERILKSGWTKLTKKDMEEL